MQWRSPSRSRTRATPLIHRRLIAHVQRHANSSTPKADRQLSGSPLGWLGLTSGDRHNGAGIEQRRRHRRTPLAGSPG